MAIYVAPQPLTDEILELDRHALSRAQLDTLHRESGLTKETLEAHRWRRVPQLSADSAIATMHQLIGFWNKQWGECLLIPYFDEHNKCVMWRVRPENPYFDKDGKLAKYLQPKGVSHRIYFTNGTLAYLMKREYGKHNLANPANAPTVVITEGERKAVALSQCGYFGISIPGIGSWCKPKSKYKLHSDLQKCDWNGIRVIVAFDSDVEPNNRSLEQRRRLADALKRAGALVHVVPLFDTSDDPNDFMGAKVGLDDILARDGLVGLQKILEGEANYVPDEKPYIKDVEPETWARHYQDHVAEQGRRLVYWHGFYEHCAHGSAPNSVGD